MQKRSWDTSTPTSWVMILFLHMWTFPISPRRTTLRCTGSLKRSKRTAFPSWVWSRVFWRMSWTKWAFGTHNSAESTACSVFHTSQCLSAGCPGHRPGLHRLHRSHDAFPSISLLVSHVLLHAHQPRSGQHDRHHDWHHHTCPWRLQSPEGAFYRYAAPQHHRHTDSLSLRAISSWNPLLST